MVTHYQRLKPEPIEVIESWGLGFHLGSALEYIARAPYKGQEARDLTAAIWYIKRHLQLLEAAQKGTKPPNPDDQV